MSDVCPHLPNAPIREAIIDIQFDASSNRLEDLKIDLAGYSEPESINLMAVSISVGEGGLERETQPKHIGYRYVSEDEKKVLQVRHNGFTYSQLRPYTNWADFSQNAKELWDSVSPLFVGARVRRVAVRYVNRLLAPFSSEGVIVFKDYFSNAPELPGGVDADVRHYLTRMVIAPRQLESSVAVVNQTIEEGSEDGCLPLILDIDVFVEERDFATDDPRIWELLGKLRIVKNDVFKGTMTKRALELCL